MRKLYAFFVVFGIAVIYLVIFNLILSAAGRGFSSLNGTQSVGTEQKVSVGNVVQVTIVRHKFYGTIFVEDSKDPTSNLYLFNLIKIPLKKGNVNFLVFHGIFVLFLILAFLLLTIPKSQYL